jgi:hypothetical protein
MKNVPPSSSIFYIGLCDRLIKLLKVTPDEGHSLETSVVASLYQRKFWLALSALAKTFEISRLIQLLHAYIYYCRYTQPQILPISCSVTYNVVLLCRYFYIVRKENCQLTKN